MHIELIERLNDIGIALSQEKDIHRLLRRILTSAKQITNADAATLYCLDAQQRLRFEIVINDSLGARTEDAELSPISIYNADTGHPNTHLVVVYAVVNETTVNISDAHARSDYFNFSGTAAFDRKFGYRTQSILTIPFRNFEDEVIGAFQLINAQLPGSKDIVPFSAEQERLVESLASQAAVALTRHHLARDRAEMTAPISVLDEDSGKQEIFSKSRLTQRLELCAISHQSAEDMAWKVYSKLLAIGLDKTGRDALRGLTHDILRQELGEEVARRFLVWERFRDSGTPLVLLIGGATGTGKSMVASEIATRLGIDRVHSSDTLREVMRLVVPEFLAPSLHASSYKAGKQLHGVWSHSGRERRSLLIEGYQSQACTVASAMDAVINRALEERQSAIIEGVHVFPAFKDRIRPCAKALVVSVVLAVPKPQQFSLHFEKREAQAPQREAEGYMEHIDAIRQLQRWLVQQAEDHGVPVVPNISRSNTVRQVLRIITRVLEREYMNETSETQNGLKQT